MLPLEIPAWFLWAETAAVYWNRPQEDNELITCIDKSHMVKDWIIGTVDVWNRYSVKTTTFFLEVWNHLNLQTCHSIPFDRNQSQLLKNHIINTFALCAPYTSSVNKRNTASNRKRHELLTDEYFFRSIDDTECSHFAYKYWQVNCEFVCGLD